MEQAIDTHSFVIKMRDVHNFLGGYVADTASKAKEMYTGLRSFNAEHGLDAGGTAIDSALADGLKLMCAVVSNEMCRDLPGYAPSDYSRRQLERALERISPSNSTRSSGSGAVVSSIGDHVAHVSTAYDGLQASLAPPQTAAPNGVAARYRELLVLKDTPSAIELLETAARTSMDSSGAALLRFAKDALPSVLEGGSGSIGNWLGSPALPGEDKDNGPSFFRGVAYFSSAMLSGRDKFLKAAGHARAFATIHSGVEALSGLASGLGAEPAALPVNVPPNSCHGRVSQVLARYICLDRLTCVQVGSFTSSRFNETLRSLRFARASDLLAHSDWCMQTKLQRELCAEVAASIVQLQHKCSTTPHWVQTPNWQQAQLTARSDVPAVWAASSSGADSEWQQVEMVLDMQVDVAGLANCGDGPTPVTLQLTESGVKWNLYRFCPGGNCPSESEPIPRSPSLMIVPAMGVIRPSLEGTNHSRRWWTDADSLFLRREVIDLHDVTAVCTQIREQQQGSVPNITLWHRSLGPGELVTSAARHYTSPLNAVLSGSPVAASLTHQHHVAPLVACSVACHGASRLMSRQTVRQMPLGTLLNRTLNRCVRWLMEDYSTCGLPKATADDSFRVCVNAPSGPGLHSWWQQRLAASTVAEEALRDATALNTWWRVQVAAATSSSLDAAAIRAELSTYLDCSKFHWLQVRSCTCERTDDTPQYLTDSSTLVALGSGAAHGLQAAAMGCLASSVGDDDDPAVTNEPIAVSRVNGRLAALGFFSYLGTGATQPSVTATQHARRIFACAVQGVHHFETRCDDNTIGQCHVDQVLCKRPTSRNTCLQSTSCMNATFAPHSLLHNWLRARDAPRWQEMPTWGDGFAFEEPSLIPQSMRRARYGTSWLRDALIRAGRRSSLQRPSQTIRVLAASLRNGGVISRDVDGLQSGLQLLLIQDDGDAAMALQRDALKHAGFSVEMDAVLDNVCFTIECAHTQQYRVMVASLSPPHLTSLSNKVPYLDNTILQADAEGAHATLTIHGTDLGTHPGDVLGVSVGPSVCTNVEWESTMKVIARCPFEGHGGVPALLTASGGLGTGCKGVDHADLSELIALATQQLDASVSSPAAVLRELIDELHDVVAGFLVEYDLATRPRLRQPSSLEEDPFRHLLALKAPFLVALNSMLAREADVRTVAGNAMRVSTVLDASHFATTHEQLTEMCSWARQVENHSSTAAAQLPELVWLSGAVTSPLSAITATLGGMTHTLHETLARLQTLGGMATNVEEQFAAIHGFVER